MMRFLALADATAVLGALALGQSSALSCFVFLSMTRQCAVGVEMLAL